MEELLLTVPAHLLIKPISESNGVLSLTDSTSKSGIQIHADIYPFTAFSTVSSILIPQRSMAEGKERLRARITNSDTHNLIKMEMRNLNHCTAGGEELSKKYVQSVSL